MEDNQILEILNNVNFGRIHQVMEFLNWTWFKSGGVPTYAELVLTVRDMVIKAIEQECSIESGGFYVEYFRDAHNDGEVIVRFVL